ncbi:25-hydroxyvitamin D-1 alpha hydroxylase, mitochondrial-like [Glandiceps talaboti]
MALRCGYVVSRQPVINLARNNIYGYRTTASTTQENTNHINGDAKPFEQIPSTSNKFVTYLDIIRNGGVSKMDKFFMMRRQQFGPIWREDLGGLAGVFVADPNAAAAVFRSEGKYPRRPPVDPWLLYRKLGGYSLGVFLSDGEDWHRHRSVLIKPLLRPKQVASHTDTLSTVADDLVAKIRRLRDDADGKLTTNIDDEVFRWSMEAVASTLFEKRLGLLKDTVDPTSEKFIQAAKDFFRHSESVIFFPSLKLQVKLNLPAWRKMRENARIIFEITEMHMNTRIAEGEQTLVSTESDGEKTFQHIIPYLMSSGKLSSGEILANAAELFGAAVDTTSNTMLWTLDLLAWNPDVQERLHQEITNVVPKGEKISQEHLKEFHYLKAVVRESMRLFPVVYGFSRILNKDAVVGGYKVPEGTTVIILTNLMSRDSDNFENPDDFKPERWLRSEKHKHKVNQFASQPFGTGTRQCIGRRISELEMYLCLAKITQNFRLEPNNDKPLEPCTRLILVPDKPLYLKFHERK